MRFTFVNNTLKLVNMAGCLKTKRPRLTSATQIDTSYFDSYADISVHEEMLGDEIRTNAYKNAIFSLKKHLKDKVVLDIGAGTGILSCFCAQAGAKKIYAVEASDIAKQAEKVVVANGFKNQIEVIHKEIEDVNLPEKVDVIISEWMGYCLLYESMLSSVIIARDRWLKPKGIMLPNTAAIYLVPVCDEEAVAEKVNFWNDIEDVYGVDMSCMLPFARKSLSKEVMVKSISCENVLSKPQLMRYFNLSTVTQEDIDLVTYNFSFNSFGIGDFQGFAIWFDVFFPSFDRLTYKKGKSPALSKSEEVQEIKNETGSEITSIPVSDGETEASSLKLQSLLLSTSPYKPETHWKQSVLYLDKESRVQQDSLISGSIAITPSQSNRRFLNINLTCQVENDDAVEKNYFMGYEAPICGKSN